MNEAATLPIRRQKIVGLLWTIMAVVALAGLGGQIIRYTTGHEWVYGLVPKTNLNGEGNLPAYFSSMILLISSMLLAVIAVAVRSSGRPFGRHWTALAVIFLWLSLDEAAAFHELATEPLQAALGTGGILFYAWVIPAIMMLGVFAVAFWPFFISLPTSTKWRFAVAGAVYVGATLGIEFVEAAWADVRGEGGFAYVLMVAIEETVEMVGIILFIDALLRHIVTHCPKVDFLFSEK